MLLTITKKCIPKNSSTFSPECETAIRQTRATLRKIKKTTTNYLVKYKHQKANTWKTKNPKETADNKINTSTKPKTIWKMSKKIFGKI